MTNNTTLKATVTLVKIGVLEVEGLLLDDGRFGVAVPQIAMLFPYFYDSQNQASQKLKRLMSKDFKTHKAKTGFNRNTTLIVDLEAFIQIIKKLSEIGDSVAMGMANSLIGLSLQQLFCDAFGLKFEQAERQEWLKQRQKGKVARRTLTDAIKDWLDKHPECTGNERTYLYASTTNVLYQSLFRKTAQEMRQAFGVATNDLLRDSLCDKQLHLIDYHESYACKMIDKFNMHPHDAIKEAVAFYE